MKVREFAKNASSTTTFVMMNDGTERFDKWEVALSEYADYEVTSWFVGFGDSQEVYIECEKVEEFQSMKECIDEFFDFVDGMGMSRML